MKKILVLLLLFTGIVKGQIVTIPDANLKNRLINTLCVDIHGDFYPERDVDTNDDGEIQVNEALAVNYLFIDASEISDLTGIEYFTNLSVLSCSQNQLVSLDVSTLTNLTELRCYNNQITGLDVSNLVNLTVLFVNNNQLTNLNLGTLSNITSFDCAINPNLQSIDISNLTNLQSLRCATNGLTNLDLSNNDNLISLYCGGNQLTQLDISNLTQLKYLSYEYNNLPNLDFTNSPSLEILVLDGTGRTLLEVSSLNSLRVLSCSANSISTLNLTNPLLQALYCFGNLFSTLDLSNASNLTILRCGSNLLRSIFIKNGQNEFLEFGDTSNLELICADESQFANISNQLATLGNTSAVVTSYCSFSPGGDYNTITGTTLYDPIGDGCDVTGIANPYIKMNVNDGTNSGATYTTNSGNYTFYTQTGDFTITPQVENPSYFFISPANAVLTFPLLDNSTQTQNFCVTPNGVHPDLEIVFVPTNTARPGLEARYKMVFKNKGNQTLSGSITLNFNSTLLTYNDSNPTFNLLQPDLFTWNYSNLNPFETRTITINLLLHTQPQINIGDTLDFVATINPIPGDETPLDNVSTFNQIVVNSADPNQIQCLEGNTITTEEVGNYLHYNINFENIGTAEALNIVVKDTINTAKFDVNSLQLQYASHNVETKITGNILELIFKNINLPSAILNPIGGHGNVLFKIKTIPTLVIGDDVESRANIYFDYNDPIATNEAITSITALSNPGFVRDKTIVIAPNPTNNSVTITSKNKIQSIQLFDVQGRILQTVLENKKITTLDISNKSDGIYFLKVTTEVGSSVEKLVKEN